MILLVLDSHCISSFTGWQLVTTLSEQATMRHLERFTNGSLAPSFVVFHCIFSKCNFFSPVVYTSITQGSILSVQVIPDPS